METLWEGTSARIILNPEADERAVGFVLRSAAYNSTAMKHVFSREAASLVDQCRLRAYDLLRANLGPLGIHAASPGRRARARRYDAVFARDAGVCALAMIRSNDPDLIDGARTALGTLALHQADNGQIPKFVLPDEDADFWYVGCIDATLWWLIALKELEHFAPSAGLLRKLRPQVGRALTWLACQEHPRLRLLTQNEASDWADIMPRSGFVLYTNALWYHVKRLYNLPYGGETAYHFNHLFFPFSRDVPEYRRLRLLADYPRGGAKQRDLYLSYVNFSFFGDEGDVFGNLLAVLLGLAESDRARHIVQALVRAKVGSPWPARATCSPIKENSRQWRAYMERHRQNLSWQYHNGGCWPLIGGFWVVALARFSRPALARQELVRLAQTNAANRWQFNEWFHGRSGAARGMPQQSWSAAAYLLAYDAVAGLARPRTHKP
jgi:glycogen debranching enzyme